MQYYQKLINKNFKNGNKRRIDIKIFKRKIELNKKSNIIKYIYF